MALTNEQIEQKKQLLAQKLEEIKVLNDDLVEAGAMELSDDDLDDVAGGKSNSLIKLLKKWGGNYGDLA